ncbi:SIMPL domain-containing protein [Cognatishimia sp.]|uniref:SIMPL domain-containing protein n=1 Tax=Cognatishimia sp. TaxID=2211648 RepID=UPI0035159E0E|nr:SIMPL domain-containing protein [Cognatishimia sp.]
MLKFHSWALAVALAVPSFGLAGEIVVQGQGSVEQAPDMATITLGSQFAAKQADDALDQVSEATATVLATLTELGVEAKDVQTSGLYLNPVWDDSYNRHGGRNIRGYSAGNTVHIRVRDLDKLGGLLDQVVEDGANTFNGLSFGLQDSTDAKNEARRRAVADARAKAELYAEAAGVSLGKIIELTDGVTSSPQPVFMGRSAMVMSDAVPIAEGEVSTSARVTITFEIAE